MNEKILLDYLKELQFKNAPSLLKCYFTLGEKIEHICNEYNIDSVIKIIKKNQNKIASILTAISETWNGLRIYEMIKQLDAFSKNSKEKACELINKFEFSDNEAKIEFIQKIDNEIIVYFNEMILDINDYFDLCSNIYAINTFVAYEKMDMITEEFNLRKYKEWCDDYFNRIKKTITSVRVINKEMVLKISGTKKAPFKIKRKPIIN